MNVTFAALLILLAFAVGVTSQPVEAVEGGAVTLQCPLVPGVNLSDCKVDVSRLDVDVNDNVVHVYRDGQDHLRPQMAQYKRRTTLIREDLIEGILTLIISPVKLSDSGRYEAFVRELNARCFIDLTVVPKDQQNGKDESDSGTVGPPVDEPVSPGPNDPQNRTRRGDSSTTRPPVEGVTESDDGDAAKAEPLWKTVVPGVFGGVAALAVVVGIVLFILVKRGKIKICKKRPSATEGPEQERMMSNNLEMGTIRATEGSGDPRSAAANGLRDQGSETITIHPDNKQSHLIDNSEVDYKYMTVSQILRGDSRC